VTVHVGRDEKVAVGAPPCAQPSPGYDSHTRRWRHLDTRQYKTIVVAHVLRVSGEEREVITSS